MKKFAIVGILLSGLLVLAVQAQAASTATIGVTVTISEAISVNVSPTTWAVGSTAESAVSATAVDNFTATNNGNVAENFAIITGNSANWTAGDTAGSETFVMKAKGGDIADWTSIRTSQALDSNVATSGTASFGLQLTAPTATGYAGSQQSITVTVTASKYTP